MSVPKVPAADQTLRMLRLLARSRGPLPASIIAAQLELPRSTVYQLLATLQEHGFVMHLPEAKRYGLGIAAVELSSAYTRQEPLARIGRPIVAALVDRMRVSGHLAVPSGSDVLYVIEERAQGAPTLVTDVDVRLPMHLTASGRAILAALPKAQVRALYPNARAFVQRDADTWAAAGAPDVPARSVAEVPAASAVSAVPAVPAVPAASGSPSVPPAGQAMRPGVSGEEAPDRYSRLRTLLDDTVTRGYALERGSVTVGLSSVAAPVLDHRAWPVAAIALTFRDSELPEPRYAELGAAVRDAANALSERIHGRGATRS